MDVLDNYKNAWKEQKSKPIRFSESDIYKMIHQKSSSIVKWIFYISIIEFALLFTSNFFIDFEEMKTLGMQNFVTILVAISFIVGVVFVYLFYKNYKNICVSDSSKKLMNDILKTKKTVSIYIVIQLILAGITIIWSAYATAQSYDLTNDEHLLTSTKFWLIIVVFTLFLLGVFWLFYQLLYGILLKRLKRNYKELAKEINLED
ncbi:MAG TPA: hypothetical protein ENK67_01800 [Flavobacteriia bacterium]|nr:hypothetical protein [Flavobacteriia bacterium]